MSKKSYRAEDKLPIKRLALKYKSGCSGYYRIHIGNEILEIPKPKDPLIELRELGKSLPDKPIAQIKREIREEAEVEILREAKGVGPQSASLR